jgi:hypothetical protein
MASSLLGGLALCDCWLCRFLCLHWFRCCRTCEKGHPRFAVALMPMMRTVQRHSFLCRNRRSAELPSTYSHPCLLAIIVGGWTGSSGSTLIQPTLQTTRTGSFSAEELVMGYQPSFISRTLFHHNLKRVCAHQGMAAFSSQSSSVSSSFFPRPGP